MILATVKIVILLLIFYAYLLTIWIIELRARLVQSSVDLFCRGVHYKARNTYKQLLHWNIFLQHQFVVCHVPYVSLLLIHIFVLHRV